MSTLSDWLDDFDFENDLIEPLQDGGWFEFVFPFLLLYAIIITILNNVPMFKKRKAVRVIISVVVSLFAVSFPITNDGITLGDFLESLFPGVTAFTLGLLALYIIAAMLGVDLMKFFGEEAEENKFLRYALGAIGILVVAYYYAKGFGWEGYEGSELMEFFDDPLLYILIVAGAVFFFLTRDEDDGESRLASARAASLKSNNPDMTPDEIAKKVKDESR